jgi:hypothetical protein
LKHCYLEPINKFRIAFLWKSVFPLLEATEAGQEDLELGLIDSWGIATAGDGNMVIIEGHNF